MQPATGPFTVHKVKGKENDPLNGSYVIKDGRRVIVAAFPCDRDGPLANSEGTARLACAAMNHIGPLLEAIEEAMDDGGDLARDHLKEAYNRAKMECPAP